MDNAVEQSSKDPEIASLVIQSQCSGCATGTDSEIPLGFQRQAKNVLQFSEGETYLGFNVDHSFCSGCIGS